MRYFIITLLALSFAFGSDAEPLPTEAQQAVDQMEAIINKARRECLVKLDKCIGDITRTGNLELALAVKNKETEIQDAMPHLELFKDVNPVIGKWMLSGNTIDIKDGGVCVWNGNVNGKWVINSSKLVISWDTGSICKFTLPIKNNILNGIDHVNKPIIITKITK